MTNKPGNSIPDAKPVVRSFARRGRGLVLAGAALFVVSSAFPVLASLLKNSTSKGDTFQDNTAIG